MKRLACLGFLLAMFIGGPARADEPGDARSILRAEGHGPGETIVRLEVEGRIAYRKQDLVVSMTFENKTPAEFRFEPGAFGPGSFDIADDKGRKPREEESDARAESDGGGETFVLPGYGKLERKVNLSAWYPRLTSKIGSWNISWNEGDWSAGPLRAAVVRPYDPRRDDTALVETDVGKMTWELLPDAAPAHVKNFVDLARAGFYDGLTLHRVVPGILIEGGDPKGDGTGGWETLLPPEISPDLELGLGMIGASRKQTSMTSSTMFFMTLGAGTFMKGKQTFFARLVSGYEVFAGIRQRAEEPKSKFGDPERLARPVAIERIRIK